ncbi:MAG: helix-turn-helix domain-containing protein [Candidatus Thermoplasmatota archaeon]|nr:helix-turn-helix domain-containing protein [Candidatus Thermoplasmatota archaeon]
MRRVSLRWNISSLRGSKDVSRILEIVDSVEVLGHLAVREDGVVQLAEIRLREGKELEEISSIEWLEVIEIHEEDDGVIVVSLLCTHPFAKSAIELSNIHVQPPYGIDSERGMEMRMSGLSGSIRRFVSLLRMVMPPDKISVHSIRENETNGWTSDLTERQREVISLAIKMGYYDPNANVKLKDIADELDMARSTLGEHIKRAEYEIMKKVREDL